jgi:hypothetical protein
VRCGAGVVLSAQILAHGDILCKFGGYCQRITRSPMHPLVTALLDKMVSDLTVSC